jgi:hypothetical protein
MSLNINDLDSDATERFVINGITFRRATEAEIIAFSPRKRRPPTPNRADAEAFLSALDPDAKWWTFQTFDDDKDREAQNEAKAKAEGKKYRDPLTRVWHRSLESLWDTLAAFNQRGAGIYITVNETNGDGRAASDIVRVRAVFVDIDDLRPLPTFHLKPHGVVESSAGKWHLYWRVKACTVEQYRSLQARLIRHYGSDPKIKDPSRVMRLPGFVHRKVDSEKGLTGRPFLTRLLEAHDHDPYTVEQVEVGLPVVEEKVEPSPAAPAPGKSNGQHGEEAKLRSALAAIPTDEQVLTDKLGDSHEVFVNIGRGIERLDWGELGFSILRSWCEGNAAKFDEAGLRTQWASWKRTRDGCKKPVTVKTIYYYARKFGWKWRKESAASDAPPSAAVEDFYAYLPHHSYVYMPTRELWPASSVNTKVGEGAAEWLDRNRPVVQMVWAPGMSTIISNKVVDAGGWIDKPGDTVFNLYRPPTLPLGDKDRAAPWIGHVRRVYPDEADHIISYLAHRVQRPHEKVNHGIILGGPPGVGKDTLLEPVKRAVGPWNVAEVSPQQVLGRFNSFVKSVILRVSEARDLGELNRFALYEHMKAYLAAPPDVIRCDEKNIKEHAVLNVMGVVITSNRKDSFYLPEDDRRHFVAWCELTKEDFADAYWKELWGWYESEGGYSHVAAYLATLDIAGFNPKAPPPKTAAFMDIVVANRSSEDSEFRDAIEQLGNPDALTVSMIRAEADSEFKDWLGDRRNNRQIHHRLGDCGYVPAPNPHATKAGGFWSLGGKRHMIYAKADLSVRERHRAAETLKDNPPTYKRWDALTQAWVEVPYW